MEELNIEDLLDAAFIRLKKTLGNNGGRFHITLLDGGPRISEQELKYCFLETFIEKGPDSYTYSVETPTIETYRFSEKGKKLIKPQCCTKENGTKGRKGNIDVVLYAGDTRTALIEFKANTSDLFKYSKDFCKLENEREGVMRYFVEIFVSTTDGDEKKIENKLYCNDFGNIANNTVYIGYSLNHLNTGNCVKFVGDNKCQKVSINDFPI